jgi:hypothetical protein
LITTLLKEVLCDYCRTVAILVGGIKIYPHRKDLYKKNFWLCEACGAYVGTYKDDSPLGRLADAELRIEKEKAHKVFDPLWQKGKQSRSEAYVWLAKELKIHEDQCHIGMFDIDMCKKVVSVCTSKRSS